MAAFKLSSAWRSVSLEEDASPKCYTSTGVDATRRCNFFSPSHRTAELLPPLGTMWEDPLSVTHLNNLVVAIKYKVSWREEYAQCVRRSAHAVKSETRCVNRTMAFEGQKQIIINLKK